MYDTMDGTSLGPLWPKNVYNTLSKCKSCTRNLRRSNKQRKLRLFLPAGPLKSFIIDIVSHPPDNDGRNKYIVVVTDRCSELAKAIPTANAATKMVANIVYGTLGSIIWSTVYSTAEYWTPIHFQILCRNQ